MRVKTQSKRQAILDIATDLFREVGYERASMAMISSRLGGSKATLYSYFSSKEELFATAMVDAVQKQAEGVMGLMLKGDGDIHATLYTFGLAYLRIMSSADVMAIVRTGAAAGAHSPLGPQLYKIGPENAWTEGADNIRELQQQGYIREGNPKLIAMHFKALLDAGIFEPMLYGAPPQMTLEEASEAAVEVFLRAYGQ